ncbi:MAG: ParB/RepB/Spo0J family partition protein [Alphaproteobacteria bacterium]|nr:ParB/RepB/Spo0J family partition protein [Alphaproteobacteria bacterium]
MDPKNRGLGRGLNALFEDDEGVYPQVDPEGHIQGRKRDMVGIDQLEPGPGQPRTIFRDGALDELSESIKLHGVLQPLLVREHGDNSGQYQIIAGERRWRAAQKAQLHEVPVIVLSITDAEAFEIALIENLQREDLDPIDEATGYQKLIDEHNYTQEKLAESLGKSRSHIANMMRLLQLPPKVQTLLSEGMISIGHARALITAENAQELAKIVISQNLSVRETEKLVADSQGRSKKSKVRAAKSTSAKDIDTLALEEDISTKLGMRVSIDSRDGKSGKLNIQFKTLDQLDDLIRRLSEESGSGRLSA